MGLSTSCRYISYWNWRYYSYLFLKAFVFHRNSKNSAAYLCYNGCNRSFNVITLRTYDVFIGYLWTEKLSSSLILVIV